jgi:hypothetical protein
LSNRAAVQRVLAQTVHSLDGVERPALNAIIPVLKAAQREVEHDFRTWLSTNHGEDTFTAQRYRNALSVLNTAIRKGGALGVTVERALKTTAKRLGPLSSANIHREWAAFSHIFEGTVQPLAIDEALVIARGDKLLWPRFERSAAKYAGEVGDRTRVQLAISRARSETFDELTNRLQRKLPSIFHAERWDAERLARNETMHAYGVLHQEAISEAARDDDQIRERIDGSADGRRCINCAYLDGKVYDVGEGPELPYHVCCRCIKVIWRESWASFANHTSEETISQASAKLR